MVLIDDVVVAVAAAVTTATLVVLIALLAKYRALIQEVNRSNQLAKDLWDAMNQRLLTQDTRIVDMMAKFEVASLRKGGMPTTPAKYPRTAVYEQPRGPESPIGRAAEPPSVTSQSISQTPETSQPLQQQSRPAGARSTTTTKRGEVTEAIILRALLLGPHTSIDILALSGVTREHNARLLKSLWSRGLLSRDERNKPYVYEITEAGRAHLAGAA